ncbi:MAG: hypothetical protein KDC61_11745 [Saprospiraceae bacterium]|nr:hypothetical protein [Saprospiraceae bacterium]MCB0542672.1 hypothetical protein [Saprospiraceae bacterium]MCB0575224.1 hypothetical protein [Saprospiraceae bacterium]MCB9356379.1 hypothetical protein [Lewinellaceae bacterium]
MKKIFIAAWATCTIAFGAAAQSGGLLSLLDEQYSLDRVTNAFKSPRVINTHSMEMLSPGTMDFRILHRFGEVSQGAYQLFGLDQASMRLGLDFGITSNLSAGVGRSTAKKEVDGFLKYRILWQSTGRRNIPVSVVWVSGMTVNGLSDPIGIEGVPVTFSRRLGYYHELIIGRKFNEWFTLQVSPTLIHNNLVANRLVPNELYAVGIGGRAKFTKRIAFVWDYTYVINRFPANLNYNPLSIGFDIETGGHVFQLHFSNAVGMNERAYISDANSNWLKGEIRFGFNLSRVFQLVKRNIF